MKRQSHQHQQTRHFLSCSDGVVVAVSSLSRALPYDTIMLRLSVQTSSADLAILIAHGSTDVLIVLMELG